MRKPIIYLTLGLLLVACSSNKKENTPVVQEVKQEIKKENTDMREFWNERYSADEYVYGEEPNIFFKASIDKLPTGKLLLPAEGEGRNAVYAASQGWDVKAFDISSEGKSKALALAEKMNVSIDYEVVGFEEFKGQENSFDAVGLIYAHVPGDVRKEYYQKCVRLLKPGGTLILEGFSKKQLGLTSGGPKNVSMLLSLDELKKELAGLNLEYGEELKIQLSEGAHHIGEGEVVRIIARKKTPTP